MNLEDNNKEIQFEYYYGKEAEQFSFYRVPRMLIKEDCFKVLSSDAKLLYGLMLDRMGVSIKNGWLDDNSRAYIIYTVEDVMGDLGCGKDKAIKVMAELDCKKGIGLIEKVRRGLGKPDIIYVKNFVINNKADEDMDRLQEVGKTEFKKSSKQSLASRQNNIQEVDENVSNYININYLNKSYNNHINQNDKADGYDEIDNYKQIIKDNLEYDFYMENADIDTKENLQEIYEIICDVVCVKRHTLRIGKEDYPYKMVRDRFLQLKYSHVEYVMKCLSDTTSKKHNIRSYLITALYNAPTTINNYYKQEVQHDLFNQE